MGKRGPGARQRSMWVAADLPRSAGDPFYERLNRGLDEAGFDALVEAQCLTAHSGRVELAAELTARGASAHDGMRAGNWKTVRMVAHYSAGASAERGAVARYL